MSQETQRSLEKDGFRALFSVDAGRVMLRSRRGTEWRRRFRRSRPGQRSSRMRRPWTASWSSGTPRAASRSSGCRTGWPGAVPERHERRRSGRPTSWRSICRGCPGQRQTSGSPTLVEPKARRAPPRRRRAGGGPRSAPVISRPPSERTPRRSDPATDGGRWRGLASVCPGPTAAHGLDSRSDPATAAGLGASG